MSDSESFGSAKEGDPADFDALKEGDTDNGGSDYEPLAKKGTPKKVKKSPAKMPKKKVKKDKKKVTKKVKAAPAKGKGKKKAKPAQESDIEDADDEDGDPLALPKQKNGKAAKSKPQSDDEEEEEYEVEAIVGHREYNGKLVYKIRWKGFGAVDDTWEDHASLSCPDLLEMYNTKHDVKIPKYNSKKRKSKAKKKKTPTTYKKRRNSLSEESEQEVVSEDDLCDDGSGDEYEVERIIEVREKKNGTREFLVKWKRWSNDYNTWEPEENLSCPDVIERFMLKLDEAKNSDAKQLREYRKHTDRYVINTHDSGRRLSRRGGNKQRVKYYDAQGSESE